VKVSAIIESTNYDTLTVDELFSKLKSTEIDYQTQARIKNPSAPTMALVSGNSSSSSFSNPSHSFALSSLVSVTEEQLEVLGDDELALIIGRFSWFHNNCLNHRRGGASQGCFGCGDPDHFVTHCPNKKDKYSSDKRYHDKHDDTKCKEKECKHKHNGGYDKDKILSKYRKNMKAQERAFITSLSDVDDNSDNKSSPSDDESKRKVEDRFNGLCFFANTAQGFCTMALGDEVENDKCNAANNDDTSEVAPSIDDLLAELNVLNDDLTSQDKLLVRAAKERKEFREKWE
jgi:hypothetical protein